MIRVGVRELRQNASAVLRTVAAGATVEVTNHGRPVARMVPIVRHGGLDQLIAEGRATFATGDVLDVEASSVPPPGPALSEVLADMRRHER